MRISFDDQVTAFLGAEKTLHGRPRWQSRGRLDHCALSAGVFAEDGKQRFGGRMIITSHRLRRPHKFGIALLYREKRILGFDVNPCRPHHNIFNNKTVVVTHWQLWPDMEAEEDARNQSFSSWLYEFCLRAKINYVRRVKSPPMGVQEAFNWDRNDD